MNSKLWPVLMMRRFALVALWCAVVLLVPSILAQLPAKDAPDPILGKWRWIAHRVVVFQTDGKISAAKGPQGTWEYVPDKAVERKYKLTWGGGAWVDTVTLSTDSKKLRGRNLNGKEISGERIE